MGCSISTVTRFLSTPSEWRATVEANARWVTDKFLSTPSECRATGSALIKQGHTYTISIHALRVEGDLIQHLSAKTIGYLFLSTPSGWRATSKAPEFCIRIIISIHALRVEGDRIASVSP